MKFGKKSKVLAAAMAMMTLSTAAAVTGTVAWFTASNVVTADGMYIQAEKEEGFVINNEGLLDADWKTTVKASHDGIQTPASGSDPAVYYKFVPTSTANASSWYHENAEAQNAHDATTGATFVPLASITEVASSGVYKTNLGGGLEKNIYLLNSFYLKSSTTSPINATNGLWAKVSAVSLAETSVSVELNKSVRVLVRYSTLNDSNSNGYKDGTEDYTVVAHNIWAPFRTSDGLTYTVGGTSGTSVTAVAGNTEGRLGNAAVTIPANILNHKAVDSLKVDVFVYFEGEDAACFSDNITATLDSLSITVKLSTQSTIA